ncbi:MAG: hypothetical protein ACFFBP_02715 [Promethearchaeota archaeon]
MKLIKNNFAGLREINSFSKDEILEIKREISNLKAENADQEKLNDYLNEKFSYQNVLDYYSLYFSHIKNFKEQILNEDIKSRNNITNNYNLKSNILNELKLISKNLHNLSLNSQNTKRLIKQNVFLDTLLNLVQDLAEECKALISDIENITQNPDKKYENQSYIWIETNQIKNSLFNITNIPAVIEYWEEIKDLKTYIVSLNKPQGKKKKKQELDAFYFKDVYDFISEKYSKDFEIYMELIFLIYKNKYIKEIKDEFKNIVDTKEIRHKLKIFIQPIIKELIADKLNDIINEISELNKYHDIGPEHQKVDLEDLLNQKISIFLPKIMEYYFNGLEKKYQKIINEVSDLDEFKNIIESYSTKVDILSSIMEDLENNIAIFEDILKPYDSIVESLNKIIINITSEITRRKNEYEFYLKTVKKERLRENIQNFVLEKIKELNEYISTYEDETSMIIREEFPQLKQIRKILSDYKEKISIIKEEVFKKLDSFKTKDIDMYQIIKQWEDNFHKKRQQLSFLLSLMLNKIFKNFKTLIEEEETLFDTITEISDNKTDINEIPLNFALSDVLADKMTIEELKERISELQATIKKNETITELYRQELSKIEDILTIRVKTKEGIVDSTVKCTVCHEFINFAKDNIIKCPFCENTYHYLCVAFWLSKYNSCPTCQNVFLDPNSDLFDVQEGE